MSIGDDHDTSAFAVNTIRRWWQTMGRDRYPNATSLMVTADAGGSNGYRNKLWKVELAKLAAETGLDITVCHFPPGTSKWNKMFRPQSLNREMTAAFHFPERRRTHRQMLSDGSDCPPLTFGLL